MADETRNAPMWVTWLLVVVGVLLVVAGIVYLTRPAAQLPSFLPGHDAAMKNHKHVKHAVAVFGLAVLCGVGVWLSLGRKTVSTQ